MWYDELIYKSKADAKKWNPQIDEWRKKYLGTKVTQVVDKLTMLDFDKLYEQNKSSGAMLVPCGAENDSVSMGGSVDDIIRILFQSSDGNLNFIASCKCGHMKGNYNIGQKCPLCKTEVMTSFADEINIHAWVEIPENVPPFLHPVAYRILNKWIGSVKKRKTSILDCILDVQADIPDPLNKMFTRGGMQFFYDNFKDIIAYIANSRKGAKARGTREVLRFLEEYGKPYEGHPYGALFTRHIPILNQSLHILTHSGSIIFNDESSKYILQTCLEMHELIQQMNHHPSLSDNMKEQHIFATYKAWMDYTASVINDKIQGKHGFIRKCILGARVHGSGRGVIVPITGEHWDDELELPWKMMVGLFKLEICNKLIQKFGLPTNMALEYWAQALVGPRKDEPDEHVRQEVQQKMTAVDMCLRELKDECPFKGLPIILGRNPTLRHGAVQLFFVVNFKTDPDDTTIGMSPEVISAPNADFDGDTLYLASLKEMASVMDFIKIHPIMTLLGGEGDGLSSTVKCIDEMCISLHGYLTEDDTLDLDEYYQAIHGTAA